ncbi:MAG TPA: hypothetical protein VNL96_00155 [Gemmatimonadaceae bacterium]|nr:hypothetical protein [Gemmatimonadaceae bacterium]
MEFPVLTEKRARALGISVEVACTVSDPTAVGVTRVEARPLASLVAVPAASVPVPLARANEMATPATGFP